MKDYFSKADRGHHINIYTLTQSLDIWLEETSALSSDEKKYLKTALTYLHKANTSIITRLGNKYKNTLSNELISKHRDIVEIIKKSEASKDISITTDDILENLANSDVKALSEHLLLAKCKNCTQCDYLSCSIYQIFLRNGIESCQGQKCPYQNK